MPAEPQTLIEAVRHFGDLARCEMLWSAREYLDCHTLPGVATPADLAAIGLTVVAVGGFLRLGRGRLWVVGVETGGGVNGG